MESQKGNQFKHVLLDFAKVTHTDTATVAGLIEVISTLKKDHHKLVVINIPQNLRSLFEICKVNKVITRFSNESEAIMELAKNA